MGESADQFQPDGGDQGRRRAHLGVHRRLYAAVWTMPEGFADLYALPPEVTAATRNYVMGGFPVRLDGPAGAALFAYDNGAFIVQNFSSTAADVKISTLGNATELKNLVSGETLDGQLPPSRDWWRRRNENIEDRVSFKAHLLPHSYAVFALEKSRENARASARGKAVEGERPGHLSVNRLI